MVDQRDLEADRALLDMDFSITFVVGNIHWSSVRSLCVTRSISTCLIDPGHPSMDLAIRTPLKNERLRGVGNGLV